MAFPVYIKELPDTDIDRGHVTVAVGGIEFVATMELYGAFLQRECTRWVEWQTENGRTVVSLWPNVTLIKGESI